MVRKEGQAEAGGAPALQTEEGKEGYTEGADKNINGHKKGGVGDRMIQKPLGRK